MKSQELHRVSLRLSDFVERFASSLGRSERRHWCKVYLSGLLLDGKQKSIQSIAERIEGGNEQALQQFVNQSPWSYESLLKGLVRLLSPRFSPARPFFILEDRVLPKKGHRSVGVAHQYCGAPGRFSNCQCLVAWHGGTKSFRMPLAARLYLPEEWIKDPRRLDQAGVPKAHQVFREKWEIALDLLDELLSEMMPEAILTDIGYGSNREFLRELDKRRLSFVAQILEKETFWEGTDEAAPPDPVHEKGHTRLHARMRDGRRKLCSASEWGRFLFSNPRNLKTTTFPPQSGNVRLFADLPVYESFARPFHRLGPKRRLLIERSSEGDFNYYVSSLPASVSASEILCMAHSRGQIEREFRQLKEELSLDHFEGRSWMGFHHHIALCFMAYDFLQLLRLESKCEGMPTIPAVRD